MTNSPLITYNNTTLTQKLFFNEVDRLKNQFNYFNDIDDFVIIKEENPIKFYMLLFALWDCDKRIIFPNRDFFNGENITFVKFIINSDEIILNTNYTKVKNLDLDTYTVLFSSGSTGKPKGIVHKKDTFFSNAKSVLDVLKVQNITSVTPLKPYLVSALSHFLVHLLSNSHIIFIDTEDISKVQELSLKIDNLSYVGSPLHLVSMLPFIKNQNPSIFFSSGDIFYPSVIKEILQKFNNTTFFNVYGMAELGGRLFINPIDINTDESLYKNIGNNISKITIKIVDDEVNVSSKLLFEGYIIDNEFIKREGKYFASGDKVIKVNNHYEFFGRKNDEIKIAGNKVSMKYIEQKVSLCLPEEYTPIIINEEHDLIGNILILIIYSKQQIKLNRKDVITLLRKELQSYEYPHKIYITDNLPYTQTMKIDRKELKNMLGNMELLK